MKTIIVSNRLPFKLITEDKEIKVVPSSGGLVTAVKSVLQAQKKEESVWIGCADFSASTWNENKDRIDLFCDIFPIFLEEELEKKFYNGFSNSVLWPLFHYFPSYVDYQEEYLEAYITVNELMADKIVAMMEPNDVVWIHDYHFLLLPNMIRRKKPDAIIGFFLHIPFPSSELFRLLPRICRDYLLKGMVGADLIGFHTHDYTVHFLNNVQLHLGIHHSFSEFQYKNRTIKTGVFPIGIDFDQYHNAYDNPEVIQIRNEMQNTYSGKKIIFSVDRLDYTKGVMHRLEGFQLFLEKYPEWKEKVTFILVVVPSRDEVAEYSRRKKMIEQVIGNINGKFATLQWTPIVYKYSSVSFSQLIALYTSCTIALITPLRDGMNLVAKEFIASRKDMQGVLMLSELTGAAKELSDAVIINPLDTEEIADKINYSLSMSEEEQRNRLMEMQYRVQLYDVFKWANNFMDSLIAHTHTGKKTVFLDLNTKNLIVSTINKSDKCLILLDYDGTLAPFASYPELAIPTEEIKTLITQLIANQKNKVVLVSGRDRKTLEEWFGDLPLDLIAEHGGFIKQKNWIKTSHSNLSWWNRVQAVMDDFTSRCPHSFIEKKSFCICWHYRNSDEQIGFMRSRELLQTLDYLLTNTDTSILDGNKVIEIRPSHINKGNAYLRYYASDEYNIKIAIGDDTSDEELFSALNEEKQLTIKVGKGNTVATYRLENIEQVISLLKEFI